MQADTLKQSNTFRVFVIAGLILSLLVPLNMVRNVVRDRDDMSRVATEAITASWGGPQRIVSPVMTLAYIDTVDGLDNPLFSERYRHLLPADVSISVSLGVETRYRGLYPVPVYRARIVMEGIYQMPEPVVDAQSATLLQVNGGRLQLPLGTSRALLGDAELEWDGTTLPLVAQRDAQAPGQLVMTAALPGGPEQTHRFRLSYDLAGSGHLAIIAPGRRATVRVDGNWSAPGFYGFYLPREYEFNDGGFQAWWQTRNLVPAPGHEDIEQASMRWFDEDQEFGVRLVRGIDTYKLVNRATRYGVLIIGLTFLVYFCTEVLARLRLHPVQYLLVGGALCLFYLLLLSLAEHIGFGPAYVISAVVSMGLIAAYTAAILAGKRHGLLMLAVLSGLYTYLYITLRSESYALLTGSVGLFAILALVMYLTRNVDWHRATKAIEKPEKIPTGKE